MASTIRPNTDGTLSILNGSGQEVLKLPASAPTDPTGVTKSDILGLGQTWQDLIASRALGVTYTNSTGKPIEVHVATTSASNQDAMFYINGVYMARAMSSGSAIASHYMVVPNGATYSVAATATLSKWSELR